MKNNKFIFFILLLAILFQNIVLADNYIDEYTYCTEPTTEWTSKTVLNPNAKEIITHSSIDNDNITYFWNVTIQRNETYLEWYAPGTKICNYQTKKVAYDNLGTFEIINTTIIASDYGTYDYEGKGLYSAYFKEDPTEGQVVQFNKDNVYITFQPMALNWYNDFSQIQQISMVQSVTGISSNNIFIYPDVYGDGINLTYEYENAQMKETLIIRNKSDLEEPAAYIIAGGNPVLQMNFILDTNNNHINIDGVDWNKVDDTKTSNDVYIKDDDGNILYYLPPPFAIDSEGNIEYCEYMFKKSGASLYISIEIPYSWLVANDTSYPVYIDPTIEIGGASGLLEDAHIIQGSGSTYGADSYVRFRSNTQYGDSESIFKFNTTSLVDATFITSADLYLYLYTNNYDNSGEGVTTTAYTVSSSYSWSELTISGTNEPSGGDLVDTDGLRTYTGNDAEDTWFTHDVTNTLEYAINNDLSDVSIFIASTYYGGGVDNSEAVSFRSREYGSQNPYLSITYIENDTSPPVVTNQNPYTTTLTNPTITITTNENGNCKWALTDLIYSAMNLSLTGSELSHTFNYAGVIVDSNNSFYVSCTDGVNEDTALTNYDGWIQVNSAPAASTGILGPGEWFFEDFTSPSNDLNFSNWAWAITGIPTYSVSGGVATFEGGPVNNGAGRLI